MPEVVTIGETMLGFTPADGRPLRLAMNFHRFVGGAESNVAIDLVRLGHTAGWISRLGDDAFGHMILAELMINAVDVSKVEMCSGEPTGLFFKDRSTVTDRELVYYRKGSAMSRIQPEQVDEEYIASARLLHITGVTLALSEDCRRSVYRALETAISHQVLVSFDPNYRPMLWSPQEAHAEFQRVLPYVDILIPTIEEVPLVMPSIDAMNRQALDMSMLEQIGVKRIFVKQGANGASYWWEGATGMVPPVHVVEVVDTVGAGDAFTAGVIAGTLEGLSPLATTRLANAVGATAIQALGDTEGVPNRDVIEDILAQAYGAMVRER
jgi:2-dehydro-3-deoxygluconokinase